MKIIVVFILFFSTVYSQNDSTAIDFYPLNNGNKWQYKVEYGISVYPMVTYYLIKEVLSDTFISSFGKTYKKIRDGEKYYHERIDTTNFKVYRMQNNQEVYYYKLNADSGDTVRHPIYPWEYFRCHNIISSIVLGSSTITKKFVCNAPLNQYFYSLSKNFGLTHYEEWGQDWTYRKTLEYALIDGIEYGQLVNIDIKNNSQWISSFKLLGNFPNPFNNSTMFLITLSEKGNLQFQIYDIAGKLVYEKDIGFLTPAIHRIRWPSTSNLGYQITSGVYLCRFIFNGINGEKTNQTHKIMMLK